MHDSRKFVKLALLLFFVLFALSSAGVSAKNIKITQLMRAHHFAMSEKYFAEMAQKFRALHPDVDIEIITSPTQVDYEQKVIVGAAGGVVYDVLIAPVVSFNLLGYQGFFQDLNKYVTRDKSVDIGQFLPVALQAATLSGKLLGIPFGISAVTPVANVGMFREVGLSTPRELGAAWNWDAMTSIGAKISRDTNGDGVYDVRGFQIKETAERVLPLFVYNAGGNIFDNPALPRKSTFSTDPAVEVGLNYYLDFVKRDYLAVGWLTGKSAVDMNQLPETTVSYLKSATGIPFEYEVNHYPRGPVHQGSEIGTFSYSIHRDTQYGDLCWEWIKFLTTNRDNVQGMMAAWGNPFPHKQFMADYFKILSNYPTYLPTLKIISDIMQHPDAHARPQHPVYDEVVKEFDLRLKPVMRGEVSVRNFLVNMDQYTQPRLDKFK